MSGWIDFKTLRRDLNFEIVLKGYGVSLNVKETPQGRQHKGACPLQGCKDKPASKNAFSANLDKGIWQCFGCGNRGNALDFIIAIEGLDSSKGADVRKAGLIAQKKFLSKADAVASATAKESPKPTPASAQYPGARVNEPLDFTLRSLDTSHSWFAENGYESKTIQHFDLGVCSRGWLKGRVAIPLRIAGKLVGYAGRLLDEGKVTDESPLYLFPEPRIHKGIRHEFDRSVFLYTSSDVPTEAKRLFIVEGIELVWGLWQYGYTCAASTMGSFCQGQVQAIRSAIGSDGIAEVIASDNESGRHYVREVMEALMPFCAVRWRPLEDSQRIQVMDALTLHALLGAPK